MSLPPTVSIVVWGEYALFTRPELSVERLSYPFMTPSAARGILDAVLYKPEMRWHVRRIVALQPKTFPSGYNDASAKLPYRLISIRRNEIQGTIAPRTVLGWMDEPNTCAPYLVDSAGREGVQGQNRTQRNSLLLHHVAYRIDASPVLTAKANQPRQTDDEEDQGPDTIAKYVSMFNRRVKKGQCFHRPYLGCREFAAMFSEPHDQQDIVLTDWNEPLGLMLYDIRFDSHKGNRPGFFHAQVRKGILHCDTAAKGEMNEEPVRIFGWDNTEGGES